jgi:hypothetical protein
VSSLNRAFKATPALPPRTSADLFLCGYRIGTSDA